MRTELTLNSCVGTIPAMDIPGLTLSDYAPGRYLLVRCKPARGSAYHVLAAEPKASAGGVQRVQVGAVEVSRGPNGQLRCKRINPAKLSGAEPGPGRPPDSTEGGRTAFIKIRCTPGEKARLAEDAALAGLKVSEHVRRKVL